MDILVALDLSEGSHIILQEAKKLASGLSSKICLLHVVGPKPGVIAYVDHEPGFGGLQPCYVGYGPDPSTRQDQISDKFKKEHKALQEGAGELKRSGIEAVALLIQGSVIEVILRESRRLGVDMIIVGSHGHGAVYNLVMGSVSEGLLKRSPCPVLVVPTHDRT